MYFLISSTGDGVLAETPPQHEFAAGPFGAAMFFGLDVKKSDDKSKIVLDFTDAFLQYVEKLEKQWTGFKQDKMRFQLKMIRRWALPPSVIESAEQQGSAVLKLINAEVAKKEKKSRKRELGE